MEIEDPTVQPFLAQFERDGADYLYRSAAALQPIRVTAAERQAFVEDFARRAGSVKWILIGGIVITTLFMFADMSILHVPHGLEFVLAAYAATFVAGIWFGEHLRRAPERALRDRIPSLERLNWFQRYQRTLATRTWREVLVDGLFFVFLVGSFTAYRDPVAGWGRVRLAATAIVFVLFAFNVIQKLLIVRGRR